MVKKKAVGVKKVVYPHGFRHSGRTGTLEVRTFIDDDESFVVQFVQSTIKFKKGKVGAGVHKKLAAFVDGLGKLVPKKA